MICPYRKAECLEDDCPFFDIKEWKCVKEEKK